VDCRFIPAELDAGRLCQGERCPVHHKIVHFVSQSSTFFQEKKKGKTTGGFLQGRLAAGVVPVCARTSQAVMCNKKQF
jgi:hypothetical protein